MVWYAIAGLLLLVEGVHALEPILHMAVAGFGCLTLYKCMKRRTGRPRPFSISDRVSRVGDPRDLYSFPSGHTMHAVTFAVVLVSHYPQAAILLVPLTILVALSRVILGLHYPSDVLVGGALGAAIGAGALCL
jgi:undecaprenyl-diphosphatase